MGNIFSVDSRWVSGLGNLGPILQGIIAVLGPILTVALAALFVWLLVKRIIELNTANSDEEKKAARNGIIVLCLSLGLVVFATLIVTALFFALGNNAAQVTTPTTGGTPPATSSMISGQLSHVFEQNTYRFGGAI